MIRAGQRVHIRKEFQDPGDENIVFHALEDEDGGRVRIQAQLEMAINPVQVVETRMLVPSCRECYAPLNPGQDSPLCHACLVKAMNANGGYYV